MNKKETAEKIKEIIELVGSIPKEHIQDAIDYAEEKQATYGLMHMENYDTIFKRKERAKAILLFKETLEKTEEVMM